MVVKTIEECGHAINVECSAVPTRKDCQKSCKAELECGHRCTKKCSEPCTRNDCVELVTTSAVNLCGHKITIACKDLNAGISINVTLSFSYD